MPVDYDLVIIGNTPAGIQSAIQAAHLKARVALVTQRILGIYSGQSIHHSTLVEIAHQVNHPLNAVGQSARTDDWSGIKTWIEAVAANLETANSLAALASLGVDIIPGLGEFCRKPSQGFTVGGRFLSARAYLLTLEPSPALPDILAQTGVDYLTVDEIALQLERLAKAQTVMLLGGGIMAVELAQALQRLGLQVTLLTSEAHVLLDADPEVARLIQVQLETEGIQVMPRAEITQVEVSKGQKWVWVKPSAIKGQAVNDPVIKAQIAVDEIIVVESFVPQLETLNLEAVGVKWSEQGVSHNAKLQTTNPKIYVCEGRIGSHWSAHVACYEVAIALKNALFFPCFKATYGELPLVVNTEPAVAWVGLTEAEALQRYGKKNIQILRRSFNKLPKAQMRSDLTGLCKLIVHSNGKVLGAHLVGHQAPEWIGAIALAMQQKIPIQKLADLVLPSPTLAEIIVQTAQDWQHQRLQRNRLLKDSWDIFFDWRRSWGR